MHARIPENPTDEPTIHTTYHIDCPDAFSLVEVSVMRALILLGCPSEAERPHDSLAYFMFTRGSAAFQIFVYGLDRTHIGVDIYFHPLPSVSLNSPRNLETIAQTSMGVIFIIDSMVIRSINQGVACKLFRPPPPPPTRDMRSVFDWQRIYHPRMSDKELGELLSMAPQSIRNMRNQQSYTQESWKRLHIWEEIHDRLRTIWDTPS